MFDFEKFPVYIKTYEFISSIQLILKSSKINSNIRDQLYRASSSILFNIAEGSGKFSKRDKKNFYTIARGSLLETVSIINLLQLEGHLDQNQYADMHEKLDLISRMLTGLIKKMYYD